MGQIEELPDDYDESQPPPAAPPPAAAPGISPSAVDQDMPFPIREDRIKNADPMAPAMPPAMAAVRSHTADELADIMKKTPLFMTELDAKEAQDNELIQALHALQYEGTRGEVAQSFREQGNDAAKLKQWIDAKEFYTKAIAMLNVKPGDDKWEKPTDPAKEERLQREAREACYANRALCNLELGNYRMTTQDCAEVLKVNPRNVKAFYRSSMALLKLDKIEEAEDTTMRGLAIDPDNKALQAASEKIAARRKTLEAVAARQRAEQERRQKEAQLLRTALEARRIRVRTTDQQPNMEDAKVHLTPDPLSPESTLAFPTMILYPMHAQTDFVKAVSEMDCVADHLEYLFPLPWDEQQEYSLDSVNCYMETVTGGLIKVGKKLPLLKILSGGKVEIVDELVKIMVVPTAKAQQFIQEFKERTASE